jgi:hypothetical protein
LVVLLQGGDDKSFCISLQPAGGEAMSPQEAQFSIRFEIGSASVILQCISPSRRPAGCNPATRQIANLRCAHSWMHRAVTANLQSPIALRKTARGRARFPALETSGFPCVESGQDFENSQ